MISEIVKTLLTSWKLPPFNGSAFAEQSRGMGYVRGCGAASTALANRTDDEVVQIVANYYAGERTFCPSPWGYTATPAEVLQELGVDPDRPWAEAALSAYTTGWSDGFWRALLITAHGRLQRNGETNG